MHIKVLSAPLNSLKDLIQQTDHIMLPRWGSGRMTPWDDRHIKCKKLLSMKTMNTFISQIGST